MVTIPLTWFGYHIYWDAEKVKQGFVKGAFFARIPIDKPKTFRHLHFATFRGPRLYCEGLHPKRPNRGKSLSCHLRFR